MKRLFALAAVAALSVGCRPDAAQPARDAYRASVAINNGLALSLDATALVKRSEVAREARERMSTCRPDDVPCREQAVRDAMAHGQSAFDKIDRATKLQAALAETLRDLDGCAAQRPNQPDALCESVALAAALEQIPKVIEAVKSLRDHVESKEH